MWGEVVAGCVSSSCFQLRVQLGRVFTIYLETSFYFVPKYIKKRGKEMVCFELIGSSSSLLLYTCTTYRETSMLTLFLCPRLSAARQRESRATCAAG